MRRLGAIGVALAAAITFAAAPSTAAAEPPPPLGANVACKPTQQRPYPVVLVHGTFANRTNSWAGLSPALKASGRCVYALNYGGSGGEALGVYGTGRVERSAEQLRTFVDSVLAQTGASRVDIVGHSQGGMMPRFYIKNLGGASKVRALIGLAPSNKGTRNPLAPPAGVFCAACAQQAEGSAFIRALNAGDQTPGAVEYSNLVTRYDEVVLPFRNGFLDGARRNVILQDVNPLDISEHLAIIYSPTQIALTLNWLR